MHSRPWNGSGMDGTRLAAVMGRTVNGIVVVGDRRGRQIGFPTANIPMSVEETSIRDGVFAGLFTGGAAEAHPAAISVGRRPTFYAEGVRLLEAHLLDFDGDLYGTSARIEVVEFLRPQQRFEGIDALKAQLAVDVRRTRELLVGPRSVAIADDGRPEGS